MLVIVRLEVKMSTNLKRYHVNALFKTNFICYGFSAITLSAEEIQE